MTAIAECLDTETRAQMQALCVGPFDGEPPDLATCRAWMEIVNREIGALRLDVEWGRQHGNPATEGFYFWFVARDARIIDARNRYADLKAWRDHASGANSPICLPRRLA
jgi:hypothetical protein